jgi:hypothetical protein
MRLVRVLLCVLATLLVVAPLAAWDGGPPARATSPISWWSELVSYLQGAVQPATPDTRSRLAPTGAARAPRLECSGGMDPLGRCKAVRLPPG